MGCRRHYYMQIDKQSGHPHIKQCSLKAKEVESGHLSMSMVASGSQSSQPQTGSLRLADYISHISGVPLLIMSPPDEGEASAGASCAASSSAGVDMPTLQRHLSCCSQVI